ncbi:activating signal cointegrator 1 complex subunit 3, partial [Dimargaris xerosporica]
DTALALLQPPWAALGGEQWSQLSSVDTRAAKRPGSYTQDTLPEGFALRNSRVKALQRPHKAKVLKPQSNLDSEQYPHVYRARASQSAISIWGDRFTLPLGTEREDFSDREELTIPASQPGYTSLNRVQSIVYPIAYQSNENMLVCAPTGAGKTDVALLTMLRVIGLHCSPRPWELPLDRPLESKGPTPKLTVAKDAFKIVYVAPMKALAAEVVQKMGRRLRWLGISVRELTGDMQLTKAEIQRTQIIVTTPEKWDVVTRKSAGDTDLVKLVRLIIVDEVHLLHEERGAVIESIIARTLRQVESSQSMIRIVGLSATLPNYVDVAQFLRVNPYEGMFFFDAGFRPVPLEQHFIGIKGKPGSKASNLGLNRVCYEKCADLVRAGHQVMVFVHSRNDTVKTAQFLRTEATNNGILDLFSPEEHPRYHAFRKELERSRNRELVDLFGAGMAMHHAGMLRSDRTLVERLFAQGIIKVLCCTSTLAWGVNLPAYAVVIKGTQVYDTQKGSFVDLSILDVLQIFGRAGRPQYEDQGVGYILTTHDRLNHYVSAITQQRPIESCFARSLENNLNAEVALGTVTNVDEAVVWLSYTFLYVRMRQNPLVYGLTPKDVLEDPLLGRRRNELIICAANKLAKLQMILFNPETRYLDPKDLGRIASAYYIDHQTMATINQFLRPHMTEADALALLSLSSEFAQIKLREAEAPELTAILNRDCCCAVKGGAETSYGKVNILLQAAISNTRIEDFALVSDMRYVLQNAGRLVRALFEIALNRNWGPTAAVLLSLNKCIEHCMWPFQHPLRQWADRLPYEVLKKLEKKPQTHNLVTLRDMTAGELGQLVHHPRMGEKLYQCVAEFPRLELAATIAPITRTVLRVHVDVTADFIWNAKKHGAVEPWWIWVEDADHAEIYHVEQLLLHRQQYQCGQTLDFTIPVHEPLPAQIYIRALSDRWIGAETVIPVSFQHLILPHHEPRYTDLLDLAPLPVTALNDPVLEAICTPRFTYFNPVQTQVFHTLYQTDSNALIGAPTGSGKTVAAELAMWWAFRQHHGSKVVYIAPLKALVRERVTDWRARLVSAMGKSLVELTGDVTPDLDAVRRADIIITTPEKWDGVSRGWRTRPYVQAVSLVIIDEIHLLGSERGPTLEVIVSRTNYISARTARKIRVVGLSTALANAQDLGEWLGISLPPADLPTNRKALVTQPPGLYNFRHSVRPVPLEIYIDGFPGKHYCPRMATMNKPAYRAIKTHSPTQPVIIFVSSRRQTRLTAQDLIALCGMEERPRQFLHMDETTELEPLLAQVSDPHLRLTLGFGIGLHHAGLADSDRRLAEELFLHCKIQILVATSTLAWGVNLPAHLVIVKGTEFFDAKSKGYVDYPITDILQMMGRAGRPQFDNSGIARIFVQDTKKSFYKRFLHQPFPVESSLHKCLANHLNAEITAGTVRTRQDAMEYLSWTYLYRRLRMNPTYYGMEDATDASFNRYLSSLVDASFQALVQSGCIKEAPESDQTAVLGATLATVPMVSTMLGKLASHYYLHHTTMKQFGDRLTRTLPLPSQPHPSQFVQPILELLSSVVEYAEHPVRHNENLLNQELERQLPFAIPAPWTPDSPHAKVFLLLQAYFSRIALPVADYATDTQSVLDQAVRILQAMIDTTGCRGYLTTTLQIMMAVQCVKQALWPHDSSLLMLPHVTSAAVKKPCLVPELIILDDQALLAALDSALTLDPTKQLDAAKVIRTYPIVDIVPQVELCPSPTDQALPTVSLQLTCTAYKFWYQSSKGASTDSRHTLMPANQMPPVTHIKPWAVPPGQAFSERFRKQANEGWWLVLGDANLDELFAIQRLSFTGLAKDQTERPSETKVQISVTAPAQPGSYHWTLYLMSEVYAGLDQEIAVDFVIPGDGVA